MPVTVLYFAGLREAIGCGRENVELPPGVTTAGQLRDWLAERHAALKTVKNLRVAVNQQMAGFEAGIPEGAEVAFFPPVTGG